MTWQEISPPLILFSLSALLLFAFKGLSKGRRRLYFELLSANHDILHLRSPIVENQEASLKIGGCDISDSSAVTILHIVHYFIEACYLWGPRPPTIGFLVATQRTSRQLLLKETCFSRAWQKRKSLEPHPGKLIEEVDDTKERDEQPQGHKDMRQIPKTKRAIFDT